MIEVVLTFHGERKDSLVHGVGKTGLVYRGKNKKLDPYQTSHSKVD